MKPPSIMACATVFPFNSTSLRTSSAWPGCRTRCSTKNSASCFSVIKRCNDSRVNVETASAQISNGHGDDFVGGSESREHLSHAILAQRSHAEFACFLPEDKSGGALVDHVAYLIIDYKNLEYSHPALVTDVATRFAADRLHD